MCYTRARRDGRAYFYASEHLCSNFVLGSSSAMLNPTSMCTRMLPTTMSTPYLCSVGCCKNNVQMMTAAWVPRPAHGVESFIYE